MSTARRTRTGLRNKIRRGNDNSSKRAKEKRTAQRKLIKKKSSESIRELSSSYKKRDNKFKKSSIDRIKRTINKRYESKGSNFNRLKEYARQDSQQSVIGDQVDSAMTLQSDTFTAHQYKEGDRTKIIIDGLIKTDDKGFGVVDSINAIIEGFGHQDLKKIDLMIASNSLTDQMALDDLISIDGDLFKKVSYIGIRDRELSIDELFMQDEDREDQFDLVNFDPPVSSVMDAGFLKTMMKQVPKEKSVKYQNVLDKLNDYHKLLDNFKEALQSELIPDYNRKEGSGNDTSEKINDDLEKTRLELIEAVKSYRKDSKTLPHKSAAKKAKKGVMGILQKQVEATPRRRFNEVKNKVESLNSDVEDIKAEVFMSIYDAMTMEDIDDSKKSTTLGEGAGGIVKAFTFHGSPPFRAAVKIDGVSNMEAGDSGIPRDNPEQSKRAVSAYVIDRLFNFNVIPETRFFIRNNPETGIPEIGHAMGVVDGQIGQLPGLYERNEATQEELHKMQQADALLKLGWPQRSDYGSDEEHNQAKNENTAASSYIAQFTLIDGKYYKGIADDKLKGELLELQQRMAEGPPKKPLVMDDEALINYHALLEDYRGEREKLGKYHQKEDGEFYQIVHKPPSNISLKDGNVQKSLADLQLLDIIIGHADRHGENFIFETTDGRVNGIKGIDNSDTFGKTWKPKKQGEKYTSKTPDLPPVVDLGTAVKLLRLGKKNDIDRVFFGLLDKNLSEDEINAAIDRLTDLQHKLVEGIDSGSIKLAASEKGPKFEDLAEIETLLMDRIEIREFDSMAFTNSIITWGGQDVLDMHDEDNSYLGNSKALGEARGFQKPYDIL